MRSSGSNPVKNYEYITFYECVFRSEDVKGVEMRKPRRRWRGVQGEGLYERYKRRWRDNVKMDVQGMGLAREFVDWLYLDLNRVLWLPRAGTVM